MKRRYRADIIRQLDDNATLCRVLGTMQALKGDWREAFTSLGKMQAVTPADIQRVSRAAFTFDNRTIGTIDPIEPAAK